MNHPTRLTRREIQAVSLRFLRQRGRRGATEDELHAVVNQVAGCRFLGRLADGVVAGDVGVEMIDGQLVIVRPCAAERG